jgi:hypothetical protein
VKRIISHPIARIIAAVLLVGVSVYLLSSVYRRVRTPLQLLRQSITVEGVVTEKLIEKQPDRFLPFDPVAYVVRYAYPTPQGQVRTGEQPVTRAIYRRLGPPGTPAPVTFGLNNPGLSAIDPHLTFPGSSGWRLGIGCCLLTVAVGIFPIKELLLLLASSAEQKDLPQSSSDEPAELTGQEESQSVSNGEGEES